MSRLIAYVKGTLAVIQEQSVIVDISGIGYEVLCANPFVFQDSLNEDVFIYTYHHVREDIQQLYGFKYEDEKFLFEKLISVSGIGPKSAIGILGSVDVSQFIAAVEQEDEKYLTQFPGVGKKTARQIILDLKGKLTNLVTIEATGDTTPTSTDTAYLVDVKEALLALGYSDKEIQSIIPELLKENTEETDTLIRKALTLLMKQ